ncbi:hypothetical protein AWC38_SpisGene17481 [Stylophora pistillata]|uniref:Uncharacterized protein n=1 Tax=Stylophora pistillata TaxID=50429 RepID=A0A2B4RMX6_STYPI|nr:hypothetical protein AWC38_SpisGene17481 [Stylophora pistillata]
MNSLNNVLYSEKTINVWKASNVGEGKKVPVPDYSQPLSFRRQFSSVYFSEVSQALDKPKPSLRETGEQHPDKKEEDRDLSALFSCPHEVSVKMYQRHYALENQLLYGQWWALRATRKATRFSDSQRQYLHAKFKVGQATGVKLYPVDVARDMRYARNQEGQKLLTVRRASKFRHIHSDDPESDQDQDIMAAEKEIAHRNVRAVVLKVETKDKSQYIEHFGQRNWQNLPELEKEQHERIDCQGCAVHHYSFQSLFPSWGKKISLELQQAINKRQNRVLRSSNAANVKPTLTTIKQAATKIYEDINGPFQEIFGMSFAKAQTKTPEFCLHEQKNLKLNYGNNEGKNRGMRRSKYRDTGQTVTVTPCWPNGRLICSDRNSVLPYSLKHQRTLRIDMPNGKA